MAATSVMVPLTTISGNGTLEDNETSTEFTLQFNESTSSEIPSIFNDTSVEKTTPNTPAGQLLQTDTTVRATRVFFLGIFILIGFVGNSVLIATISQSRRLKKITLNLFILSIASVNLLDTLVNLPLILGASLSEEWTYGQFVCQLNAFCIQLTSIVMLSGLMMMTVDRFAAVIDYSGRYNSALSPAKANLLIIISWAHGLALCLVLLLGVVRVKPYHARYLCSVREGANIVYICFISVFGYIIPILIMTALFVYIIKTVISEKIKERKSSSKHTYTDESTEKDRLWIEINSTKFIGILVILWCVCEGPYLLLVTIAQFENSKQLRQVYGKNSFEYQWQLDITFTLFRHSYVIVLPIISFIWYRDILHKLKKTVLCGSKDTSIKKIESNNKKSSKASTPKNITKAESRTSLRVKKSSEKERELSLSDGSVPVLFATPNGLHFQSTVVSSIKNPVGIPFSEDLSDSEAYATEPDTTDTTVTQVLTSRKCDVYGSGLLGGVGEDTSDYDSYFDEIDDPLPESNPNFQKPISDMPEEHSGVQKKKSSKFKNAKRHSQTNATDFKDENEEHNDTCQEILQNIGDDKMHNESENGTIGKKRQQKNSSLNVYADSNDQAKKNDPPKSHDPNEAADEPQLQKPKKRKKKKKKKDKVKISDQSKEMELHDQSHISSQGVLPLPRILPKLDLHCDSTETVFSNDRNEQEKLNRPLPQITNIPQSQSARSPTRQLSDNTEMRHDANVGSSTDRAYRTQRSLDGTIYDIRIHTARPTPSPRKSLLKQTGVHVQCAFARDRSPDSNVHLLENGSAYAFLPEDQDTIECDNSKATPVKKTRRK